MAGRNCVFIDQILFPVRIQNDHVRIKPLYSSFKLKAIGQENGHGNFFSSCLVQKNILQIHTFVHISRSFQILKSDEIKSFKSIRCFQLFFYQRKRLGNKTIIVFIVVNVKPIYPFIPPKPGQLPLCISP